ncbi:MAG: hypothetical protein V1664_04220 [Candidatus Uhrbacteria bacterium]
MKLKIVENLPGQSLIVTGRPSISTVLFTLILFIAFVCSIFYSSDDKFGTIAIFFLLVLFLFLLYQSFIRLKIFAGQEIIYKNGLKIEKLDWKRIKIFSTNFKTKTAKGTTVHAANIMAVCTEGEINIFHVASGDWGKNNEVVWWEIKVALLLFKF